MQVMPPCRTAKKCAKLSIGSTSTSDRSDISDLTMEDLTGRQFGPYKIIGPLGEGGMASVYKAHQPAVNRDVALKILGRHFMADPEFITRFKHEAWAVAQ